MRFRGGVGVLLAATTTAVFTGPGQTIGVSVFIDHFAESLGLGRSTISFAYLIGTLSGAALLPAVGRFIDERGVRLSQVVIGAAFAVALLNMSFVNGAIWLAAGFVGIRLLGQGSLTLVAVVTISTWYRENRGTVIGVFSTATSSLMALTPLVLTLGIDRYGWRTTWRIAAVAVAFVVITVAVVGLRQLPRGTRAPVPDGHSPVDQLDTGHEWDRRRAVATRQFVLLACLVGSSSMLSTALNFHQIDLMGSVGISSVAAAALFLPQVLGSAVAGLLFGWLTDATSGRLLPSAAAALIVLALVLGSALDQAALVVPYAVTLGAMGGAVGSLSAALLPGWFGTAHLGAIQGSLQFITVAFSALGPVLLSLIEAQAGYPAALLGLTVIPLAVAAFGLLRLPELQEPSSQPVDTVVNSIP